MPFRERLKSIFTHEDHVGDSSSIQNLCDETDTPSPPPQTQIAADDTALLDNSRPRRHSFALSGSPEKESRRRSVGGIGKLVKSIVPIKFKDQDSQSQQIQQPGGRYEQVLEENEGEGGIMGGEGSGVKGIETQYSTEQLTQSRMTRDSSPVQTRLSPPHHYVDIQLKAALPPPLPTSPHHGAPVSPPAERQPSPVAIAAARFATSMSAHSRESKAFDMSSTGHEREFAKELDTTPDEPQKGTAPEAGGISTIKGLEGEIAIQRYEMAIERREFKKERREVECERGIRMGNVNRSENGGKQDMFLMTESMHEEQDRKHGYGHKHKYFHKDPETHGGRYPKYRKESDHQEEAKPENSTLKEMPANNVIPQRKQETATNMKAPTLLDRPLRSSTLPREGRLAAMSALNQQAGSGAGASEESGPYLPRRGSDTHLSSSYQLGTLTPEELTEEQKAGEKRLGDLTLSENEIAARTQTMKKMTATAQQPQMSPMHSARKHSRSSSVYSDDEKEGKDENEEILYFPAVSASVATLPAPRLAPPPCWKSPPLLASPSTIERVQVSSSPRSEDQLRKERESTNGTGTPINKATVTTIPQTDGVTSSAMKDKEQEGYFPYIYSNYQSYNTSNPRFTTNHDYFTNAPLSKSPLTPTVSPPQRPTTSQSNSRSQSYQSQKENRYEGEHLSVPFPYFDRSPLPPPDPRKWQHVAMTPDRTRHRSVTLGGGSSCILNAGSKWVSTISSMKGEDTGNGPGMRTPRILRAPVMGVEDEMDWYDNEVDRYRAGARRFGVEIEKAVGGDGERKGEGEGEGAMCHGVAY